MINHPLQAHLDALRPGTEIRRGELDELNKALRAVAHQTMQKSGVGYPEQGASQSQPGTEVSPLIPQSIQPTLVTASHGNEDIVIWPTLFRRQSTQPLHEYTTTQRYGSDLPPFFAEGRIGPLSTPEYKREIIRVKYMMEYIQLTDVAAMLTTVINNNVLAQRTMDAAMNFVARIEKALIWSDELINPLAFDGILASIRKGAPQNYFDLRGGELKPDHLNAAIGRLRAAPNFSKPTVIYCTFAQYQYWRNQYLPISRVNLQTSSPYLTLTPEGELRAVGYGGTIPIVPVTFLPIQPVVPEAPEGDAAPPAITSLTTKDTDATNGQWRDDEDTSRDIYVRFVAYGEGGRAAATPAQGPFNVAVTDALVTEFTDAGVGRSGDNSLIYYGAHLARVPSGATPGAMDWHWVGDFARGSSGNNTEITLTNQRIPGMWPVIILQNTPDVLQFTQMLDLTRRVITVSRATTMQFAMMLFGSFTNMVAKKHMVFDNVSPGNGDLDGAFWGFQFPSAA